MIASSTPVNVFETNDAAVEQKFMEERIREGKYNAYDFFLEEERAQFQVAREPKINICGDLSNMKGVNQNEEIQIKDFGKMISADGLPIPASAINTMIELGKKYNVLNVLDTITKNVECIREYERESYIEVRKLKNRKTNEDYTYIATHCHGEIDMVLHDINVTAILNSINDMDIIYCRKIVRGIIECIIDDMKKQNPNKKFDFDTLQDIRVYND